MEKGQFATFLYDMPSKNVILGTLGMEKKSTFLFLPTKHPLKEELYLNRAEIRRVLP
jgi:hypothetical protein